MKVRAGARWLRPAQGDGCRSDELDVEHVDGAGDARVVGADEHFQGVADVGLGLVYDLGGQHPNVVLDAAVVLGGGDDAVGLGDDPLVVVGVVVDEGSARGFADAYAAAGRLGTARRSSGLPACPSSTARLC